ncbi:MAG: restriction endonuclease subunit S [Planctomycetaceae bacterium]
MRHHELRFDDYQRLRFQGDVEYPSLPLKYVATISGGATPNRGHRDYWEGDIPWVSPKDMKSEFIHDSLEHITEFGMSAASLELLPINSLLIVVRGMILAHTLPVALNCSPVTMNQDMRAIRFDDRVLPEFALLYFQGFSSWLLTQVTESAHGTKKLDTQVIQEIPVVLFPLELQRRIVETVRAESKLLSDMDHRTRTTIELLHERRSALIAAAVTGQITIDDNKTTKTKRIGKAV